MASHKRENIRTEPRIYVLFAFALDDDWKMITNRKLLFTENIFLAATVVGREGDSVCLQQPYSSDKS